MGCGCGQKRTEPDNNGYKRTVRDNSEQFVSIANQTRDRQAMCYGCEHAERSGLTVLSCEGLPIVHRVNGAPCPLSRHPDRQGVVNWAGLDWYGVPYPIRLWAWITHPKHPKPSSFTGCGCIKTIKDALREWLSPQARKVTVGADRASA